MRKFKLGIVATVLVGLGLITAPVPAHAVTVPDVNVVWESEDSGAIAVPNADSPVFKKIKKDSQAKGLTVDAVATLTFATRCAYGQHTQKAIDWPSGATLASHVLRVDYCYNGSAIVGTPIITRHSTSVTAYGATVLVHFDVSGQTGPSKISTYSWTATGYAVYGQCAPLLCFHNSTRYVTIAPQGSGNYGWAEG